MFLVILCYNSHDNIGVFIMVRGNAEQTKNGQVVGVSHRYNTTPHHGGQAHAVPVRNQERNA